MFEKFGSFSPQQSTILSKRVNFSSDIWNNFMNYHGSDLREEFNVVKDIDNFLDLLGKMLAYLPENRITST